MIHDRIGHGNSISLRSHRVVIISYTFKQHFVGFSLKSEWIFLTPAGDAETWNQSSTQIVTGLLNSTGIATGVNFSCAVSNSYGVDRWGVPGPRGRANFFL